MERSIRSPRVSGVASLTTSALPSGTKEKGDWMLGFAVRRSTLPVPSADFQNTSKVPVRVEENAMLAPSGDHTGNQSSAGL